MYVQFVFEAHRISSHLENENFQKLKKKLSITWYKYSDLSWLHPKRGIFGAQYQNRTRWVSEFIHVIIKMFNYSLHVGNVKKGSLFWLLNLKRIKTLWLVYSRALTCISQTSHTNHTASCFKKKSNPRHSFLQW